MKFPSYDSERSQREVEDRYILRLVSLCIIGFLAFVYLVGSCSVKMHDDPADQIKACVESGKNWTQVEDSSTDYECKE